jgi:hypothetical protein
MRRCTAEAVPGPYFPSGAMPSAACAAHTSGALAWAQGSTRAKDCTAVATLVGEVATGIGIGADGTDGTDGIEGIGAVVAPHPGGTGAPMSAAESAEATTGSYLPVLIGTAMLGRAAFHAALKLWIAVLTGVPLFATLVQ